MIEGRRERREEGMGITYISVQERSILLPLIFWDVREARGEESESKKDGEMRRRILKKSIQQFQGKRASK
jgi:hypothetical protein